jgi:mono/diheme cytochrome c family protein
VIDAFLKMYSEWQRKQAAFRRTMVFKISLIAALWVATGTAQAQYVGSPGQGFRLARVQCAECHLLEKGEGHSPNLAAPAFEHIANIPGMTAMALTAALRTSHGTMPNVIIKGSDIGDLAAYILSLKDGASR